MNPFDAIKVVIGAVIGVGIALPFIIAAHWYGDKQGYQRHIAEVAAASMKAELERKNDDAALQSLTDYNLCLEYLGDRGMPTDSCKQLQRLPTERPE